jgi:hypothetical protein
MKDNLYHDWFLTNMFILLVVEVSNIYNKWTSFFIDVPTGMGREGH